MARLTRPRDGTPTGRVGILSITESNLEGARPLVSVLALASGQIAVWPFTENIAGLDTEDVTRLAEAVRVALMTLVRKQG